MYALTGITGKVGGALAATLLAAGLPVRAVVRDATKGAAWAARGCEVALAEMEDATALTAAFAGAEAVFILPPSEFDPKPGYGQARETIDAIVAALIAARPGKALCLSTIGAEAAGAGALGPAGPGDLPAPGLVPGELALGRGVGAGRRRHPQLPGAARQ